MISKIWFDNHYLSDSKVVLHIQYILSKGRDPITDFSYFFGSHASYSGNRARAPFCAFRTTNHNGLVTHR